MTRIFKIAAALAIGLALLFFMVLFIFYRLIQGGEFRDFLIAEVEKQTQLQVKVGKAKLRMGRVMGISFGDLALLDPVGARPVMTAQRVLARVALLPLLQSRVVFYEVRLHRPALQIARDEEGNFPHLDLILKLLFQRQNEMPFSLDLRAVKIEEGAVSFWDHLKGRGPKATHFRELDLNLSRAKVQGLPEAEGSQGVLDLATRGEEKAALEFSLKGVIEQDRNRGGVTSKGKIIFPESGFELQKAWWDADLRLKELPASAFSYYYGDLLPVKSLSGTLSPHIQWQGSLAERARVKGEIIFKQLEVDAPEIFANVVAPGDGRLDFEIELRPQEVRFPRLHLRSKEINLAAQGEVRSLEEEDPYLDVNLTMPFSPFLTVRKYIPFRALKSPPWEDLVRSVNQGEVKLTKARLAGRLSKLLRMSKPGFEGDVWVDAELRGAGGDLPGDRYLPVRGVSGRLVLEKGVLYYKGFKGAYGLSQLTEVDGSQKALTDQDLLELRVRGEVDLGQLREQLGLGLFPAPVVKAASTIQELSGKGKLGLQWRTDFSSSHHYEGRLSLENTRLRMNDLSLSQVKGEVSFSPKEIRVEKATALLAGSPLQVRAVLRNYLTDKSAFDLTVDSPGVKAGEVGRILLSLGSPKDPGTARGTIRYQGSFTSPVDRKLTGSLELIGAQIPLDFFSQPLREVSGKLKFDNSDIDLQGFQGRLAGFPFNFSGSLRHLAGPQLFFSLSSPEMDLAYLLPHREDGKPDDWYDRLQAKGKISINKGRYEGFEFSSLKTDLTLEKRSWRLENFSAQSHGGSIEGLGLFVDDPEALSFSVEPRIQDVPVKGLLRWFDLGTKEITGKVNLTGNFESRGKTGSDRKRNLQGAFHLRIEDGVARRLTVLVRILSLLDLSRWFSLKIPDINQEGIRFRSVTGDFKVSRGVYSTKNLFVDSDDLRITGAGELDGLTGEMDFIIAVRPFPGMDSAVSFIPLIGTGLAAIKNSLLVASFRVKGPIDNPTVTPAPLSTLSEFFYGALAIPKGVIGLPGKEKK